MKLDYVDLKKAMDYIEKHGDKGTVTISLCNFGTVKDALLLTFNTRDGESNIISISADERAFDTITKTERF